LISGEKNSWFSWRKFERDPWFFHTNGSAKSENDQKEPVKSALIEVKDRLIHPDHFEMIWVCFLGEIAT